MDHAARTPLWARRCCNCPNVIFLACGCCELCGTPCQGCAPFVSFDTWFGSYYVSKVLEIRTPFDKQSHVAGL